MTSQTGLRPSHLVALLGVVLAAMLAFLPAAGATHASHAASAHALSYPRNYVLTNAKIGHWAVVVKDVAVHSKPSASSHVVTKLTQITGDQTQNLVLILGGRDLSATQTWYQVRLAILPNNSTGWVPAKALGDLYVVHTHLYVNRATHTAVLKNNGRTVFTAPVGNGLAPNITPAGQFYVRDKLSGYNDPTYGPLAFGTSARSPELIDSWPGGAYVGIHGTNDPGAIPSYVSHGCVRLKDADILRLAKLMTVGTPVTIT